MRKLLTLFITVFLLTSISFAQSGQEGGSENKKETASAKQEQPQGKTEVKEEQTEAQKNTEEPAAVKEESAAPAQENKTLEQAAPVLQVQPVVAAPAAEQTPQPLAEQEAQLKQTAPSTQADAARFYNQGNYLGAAEIYQNILAQNTLPSPYLYYNLANSYFKAGDSDKAIVNYYRAFRLLPRDGDIKRNLSFALNTTGQRLLPEGMPQAAFDIFYFLSAQELRGIMWFSAWLFSVSFAALMLGCKKDFCKRAVVVSGILFMVLGLWYCARLPGDSSPLAVVTVSRAEVRSGPGENFPVSLSVPRAHLVTINDSKDAWAEIEITSEKAKGWVLKNSIEEI